MTQTQTDPSTMAPPSPNELVTRAEALIPLLKENAEQTERDRRVVEENIQACHDAELFRLCSPRRYGGFEYGMRTLIEVPAALAEGCGSTAWTVMSLNGLAFTAGLFSEQAQDDVFGDSPDVRIVGTLTPTNGETRPVPGGVMVSGSWAWASGCLHAQWACVAIPITDENGIMIDMAAVLIPMSELTLRDTWFVAGMEGSGSQTIVAEDVFVPEHRMMSMNGALCGEFPTPFKDEALYRSPFAPFASLMVVGPQLGLGRAALRIALDSAPKKAVVYTYFERQLESTAFHIMVAEAALKLDTAQLHLLRAADAIDEAAALGEPMPTVIRARCRADGGYAAKLTTEAIDILLTAHGASSFARSSAMQRIWRDSNTSARHGLINPMVMTEVYGKALLGIEANITALL